MSEIIVTAFVVLSALAICAWVIWLVLDDRRMTRQYKALADSDKAWTVRYAPPFPDYGEVYRAMFEVEDMPVGPGQRFETEEAKRAFLAGMERGLDRVREIDAKLRGG